MKFSLVIPCYNEAANLPLLLERCRIITRHPDTEVILVDNGSTDNSSTLLQNLLPQYPGCRSVRVEKNQGYGFGILSGLHAARGAILGWTHADMQTDPKDTLKGLELFERHGGEIFVKGRRYGRPLSDSLFTMGMSVFESIVLGTWLWDINAQPNIFSRAFFDSWQNPPKDFALDLFVYYHARQSKRPVYRFPVNFAKRAFGVSHWNINFRQKLKFIRRNMEYGLALRKRKFLP